MTSTAEIDLGAVARNTATMAARAGTAQLCAVVKADGYGHGAAPVARTALAHGATSLAVAQLDELAALRAAGIDAPVLVLAEPVAADDRALDRAIDRAIAGGATFVVHRRAFVDRLAGRSRSLGAAPVGVHVMVDTGMRRIGCEPADAVALAAHIDASAGLVRTGIMTHLARADEPDVPTTDGQLDCFDGVLAALATARLDPGMVHAANSAGTIAHPRSRHDLVRCGIALYGIDPSPALHGAVDLVPALRWSSAVSLVKQVHAGDGVSYGHHHRFGHDTWVATVPVGYADGFARRLGLVGGEVLVDGRRCPIRGVVTMDQCVVELGPDRGSVVEGAEVVLIGRQGAETITAQDMARRLDTIGYEITCGIGPRVRRRHRDIPDADLPDGSQP